MPLTAGQVYKGGEITITATFSVVAAGVATPTDPITVQLKILRSDGTIVTVAGGFGHTQPGVYTYKYQPIPSDGTYFIQWMGTMTGGDIAAVEDTFVVQPSSF